MRERMFCPSKRGKPWLTRCLGIAEIVWRKIFSEKILDNGDMARYNFLPIYGDYV